MSTESITGRLPRRAGYTRAATSLSALGWRRDLLCLLILLLGVALGLITLARGQYSLDIDLGSTYGRAYGTGFYALERNEEYSYAFTGEQARVRVPGVGGDWATVAVSFDGVRPPDAEPARVTLGRGRASLTLDPVEGRRSYHVLQPTVAGDVQLDLLANPFSLGERDPRVLGVPVDRVTAQPIGNAPPVATLLLLSALAIAAYALLRRLGVSPALSLLLTAAALVSLFYGLWTARLLITVGLMRWLATLLIVHALLLLLPPLVDRIYRRSGIPLESWEATWLWRIVAVAAVIKLGGILYPHAIIFDEAAHVIRMRWILDGRFMELYRPGYTSYMGDTVGLEGGQFPYSPLWYLIITPFHFLGLDLGDAANGLSALMDVSKMFFIHIIARVTLRSRPVSLLAATLYQLIPMPYFLLSWGNYPTQFGLWASLLVTAFLVVNWDHLRGRRTFWTWVALLALSILSYTVLGVFTVSFLALIVVFSLLNQRRAALPRLRFIVAGLIAAELFVFAIYHVQFAHAMITETLPALVSGTAERLDGPLDVQAEVRDSPLANFDANNKFTVNHFTSLALMIVPAGLVLLWETSRLRRWWPLWTAWIAMFVIYSLLSAYVADMVLKHVFFMMPLVCIALAIVLHRWWRRGRGGQFAAASVLLVLAVQLIERGHFYLLIKRHIF